MTNTARKLRMEDMVMVVGGTPNEKKEKIYLLNLIRFKKLYFGYSLESFLEELEGNPIFDTPEYREFVRKHW